MTTSQLNRERPPTDKIDFLSYSINPQVHAFDRLSWIETLQGQARTVESARYFADGSDIIVSPVTLKMRWNPNRTAPSLPTPPGELPDQVDLRQLSLFAAAWTLGSIKFLAESAVKAVTYFETSGWLGLMVLASGVPLQEKFPAPAGIVFPIYHVFYALADFKGAEVITCESTSPLEVEALWLRKAGHQRILIANLGAETSSVTLQDVGGESQLRVLDATQADVALPYPARFWHTYQTIRSENARLTIKLPAFALAIVDQVVDELI